MSYDKTTYETSKLYIYLECNVGKSNKFWECRVDNANRVHRRWGKIGNTGQTVTTNHRSDYLARWYWMNYSSKKIGKDYTIIQAKGHPVWETSAHPEQAYQAKQEEAARTRLEDLIL